jgi:hypothetical protein
MTKKKLADALSNLIAGIFVGVLVQDFAAAIMSTPAGPLWIGGLLGAVASLLYSVAPEK